MIFLTVGTQLAFPRLLDLYASAAPHLVGETFAQTADPGYAGPIPSTPYLTRSQFEERCAAARVIVGHAGMGTILAARRSGKPLIVIPRRHHLGEHRNDHQMGTAEQLRRLGQVAVAETVEELARSLAAPPQPLRLQASAESRRLIAAVRDHVSVERLTAAQRTADESQSFLGLVINPLSLDQAVARILAAVRKARFTYIVTPNVDHIVNLHSALEDETLWAAYRKADLRLNDSRVLDVLAWLEGRPLTAVPGSDLTRALLDRHAPELARIAIVGSSSQVVDSLRARYPEVEFVAHFPPFGVRENRPAQEAIIAFVEQNPAPITFFAIGSPQSELLCHELAVRGKARTVALCIGSGLEFLSGHKRRAPRAMQTLRLEWLFRLLQEPARLSRRYLVKGPKILPIWLRNRRSNRIR